MASTKTLTLLTLLIATTLLAPPTDAKPHAPRTPQARVWSICKPATNPVLCYKTILPIVLTGKFNIYKTLEIEIAATKLQVDKTAAAINSLIATPGVSKSMADSLSVCKEQYDNMIDSIAETVALVAKRDVSEAKYKFSAVISYHQACNDQFDAGTSPITNDAQGVFDLGSNSLDIMHAIEVREMRRRGNAVPVPSLGSDGGPCKGVIGICG